MANYQRNQDMSEIERRRRAAARARRKKQIRRNRIVFLVVCLAVVCLLGVGIYSIVKFVKGSDKPSKDIQSDSSQPQSQVVSNAESQPEEDSSVEPLPQPTAELEPPAPAAPVAQPDDTWLLTLVNNNIPLPEDWTANIVVADEATQKELADVAAEAYKQMKAAAQSEGIELILSSGYRSVEYQQELFDNQKQKWLDKKKSEEEAYKLTKEIVSVPGYSEHNSGLAADILTPKYQDPDVGFADTNAGKWLAEHASEYGFILRYPENKQSITGVIYEPWHFRYVGVENAKRITESGKCLEEYLDENL